MSENVWAFVFMVAVIISAMTAIVISVVRTNSHLECSVEGIKYTDVRPYKCWLDNTAPEFCPLPTNIKCAGDMSGLIATNLLKEVGK